MNLDNVDAVTYEVLVELFKALSMKAKSMCMCLTDGGECSTSDNRSYAKLFNEMTDIRSSIDDICSKTGLNFDDLWHELMVKQDIIYLK
jgi:hypothetical protein